MVAILLALLTATAGAEEIQFPQGEKLNVPGIGARKCYDLRGAAALQVLEEERGLLLGTLETQTALVRIGENQLELARGKVVSLEQGHLALFDEVGTMTEKWKLENRLRHEAEMSVSVWRWATLGAGIVGLVVGVGAGALLVVWLD